MGNFIITLLLILSTTFSFGQKSENPYDFDESQYGYKTQKELGLSVLKSFEEYNETNYLNKFLLTKEIFSYAMYEYAKIKNINFEETNFEDKKDEIYFSIMSEHKIRANSIFEKIKSQNVDLATIKIDSSSSSQEVKRDMLTGKITIYLRDNNDYYRFQITGLNKLKGKWFIAEPRLYWHNSADLKLIEQIETQSN
ncbi:hypothetical protein LDL76_13520 [Salegentibacter mishustinae]|uniref:hypothetical protein n=1 Tax=Salegentibacter mishustinae TaxID=270918 RepID=UPI001CE02D05|nr:hypothetical protein [Salegentibacter mishustinae]UBZ06374.1 hypothetical protein LDL76_13520 [Salegentibacter mishustinae]